MDKEQWLNAIKEADKAYYELDSPIISDSDYDTLRNGYIEKYGDNDLNYVPGKVVGEFISFKHPTPVISLAKIKARDVDGLEKWFNKLQRIALEPKLDGLTVVAYPGKTKDSPFTYVTRGSGVEGEILPNVSDKLRLAKTNDCKYPIRGEVYLDAEDFEKIKADQIKRGEQPFKQIRNAAAGILRSKERSRYINYLKFCCYDVIGLDKSEDTKIAYIVDYTPFENIGMTSMFDFQKQSATGLNKAIYDFYKFCKSLYPIDGIVIKPMRDNTLKEFGTTGHHPNNAVAWKPAKEVYETTLRGMEFSIGRNKITPVAIFDPVEIDNTSITRASLHNKDYFDEMKLCIGDTLYIFKSNEIIPQIDSYIHNGGTPIKWMEDTSADMDKIKLIRDIEFLAKKDVLDIETLSIKTARKIVDTLNPYDVYDIFKYSKEDFMKLDGFAEKSAEKLFQNIQDSRNNVDLPHFFKALCIEGIGLHVGEAIGKKYGSMHNFMAAYKESFENIEGVGPKMDAILHDDKTFNNIMKLGQYIIPLDYTQKESISNNNNIADKNFVLTGKAPKPRSYYENLIIENGGRIQSSVNAKTNYLIIADVNSTSSKAKKARELEIILISPEDFEKMI